MSADAKLGYEVVYDVDNKRYIFNIIQGRDLTDEVFFSEDFGNILDSEIFKKTSDSINVCYLNNNGSLSFRGSGAGLERKEGIVSGDSLGYADEELQRRSDIEMAECQILLTDQFVYKEDWNLGDTVTFIDKSLGFKVEKPILEVTEVYTDRFNIDVVFGDRKPTIFDRLGK